MIATVFVKGYSNKRTKHTFGTVYGTRMTNVGNKIHFPKSLWRKFERCFCLWKSQIWSITMVSISNQLDMMSKERTELLSLKGRRQILFAFDQKMNQLHPPDSGCLARYLVQMKCNEWHRHSSALLFCNDVRWRSQTCWLWGLCLFPLLSIPFTRRAVYVRLWSSVGKR